MPKKKLSKLKDAVEKATDGRYEIQELHDGELAPTLVNRPGSLQPFDYLMEFFSLPRSDEIDPTYIFIITLGLFLRAYRKRRRIWNMSLIIAYIITRKTDPLGLLHNVAKVWDMFSFSIMFFGSISNQFFGYSLPYFNGIKLFDWTTDIPGPDTTHSIHRHIHVKSREVFGYHKQLEPWP